MTEDSLRKGKIAEKIVEQMFKEAGFKVICAGYENTFSELADQYNLLQGPAAQYIRHHPDFIVVNSNNEAFLIEVKYRRFGIIDQTAMFNYPATQVILLTKDSMHCQSLKEIHKNGKKFLPLDCLRPFSNIPTEIREKYIQKTTRLLGDENLIGQLIEKISEKIVGKSFIQTRTPGEIRFTYIEEFNEEGDSYERAGNKEFIRDEEETITTSNDKKQWSNDEIRRLIDYSKSGMPINNIAANLGRKREAVIFKLAKIGVINMHQAIDLIRGRKPHPYGPNRGRNHPNGKNKIRRGGNRGSQRRRRKERQGHRRRRR